MVMITTKEKDEQTFLHMSLNIANRSTDCAEFDKLRKSYHDKSQGTVIIDIKFSIQNVFFNCAKSI